jgi:hypothetical protein
MKVHLLYPDRDFDFAHENSPSQTDVVQDLELGRLLGAMAAGDKYLLEVSAKVLLSGLVDPGEIRYRQDILKDFVAHPDILRDLYTTVVGAIEERKGTWGIWGRSSRSPSAILSGSIRELEMYEAALKRLRALAESQSPAVSSLGLRNLFDSLLSNLNDDYFAEIADHLRTLRFREGVLISAELAGDNTGIDFTLRASNHTKSGWRQRLGLGPKTSYSFSIAPRDDAGGQILEDLRNRGINLVANAVAQSSDHIESYFAILRAELGYYISCLNLRSALKRAGTPLCYPEPLPWDPTRLQAQGLRDASLVLGARGPVVGNDLDANDRSLVVVTGANSGGKSTFLRSLGLAQIMMQAGQFVCADDFRASTCSGLFTHFIREEDESMSRGRLDDELHRMSQVIDVIAPGSLMLFNESFATTNEREGSEIARQVVCALLDSDVRVVFVTHQFDLAEGFYNSGRSGATRFLRAEREIDGRRSYKMVEEEPLPTSYGADLYQRIFSPENTPSGVASH